MMEPESYAQGMSVVTPDSFGHGSVQSSEEGLSDDREQSGG